jgi:hypothetical protein
MSEINRVAAAFLRQIERGNLAYKEEKVEVETVAEFTGLVALRCPIKKQFFYGFKPSGRPIFTHDIRLAKSFETNHPALTQHMERLEMVGETVAPHPTVWIEGKHRNE